MDKNRLPVYCLATKLRYFFFNTNLGINFFEELKVMKEKDPVYQFSTKK